MLWGIQVEISIKSWTQEYQSSKDSSRLQIKKLDVFTLRIIIKTMEMDDVI